MTTQTGSKEETQKLGEEFSQKIKAGGVVCLYGDLGAGKTTLTQGIARGLGIEQNIASPTFVLIRRYNLPKAKYLWHIDLYRLDNLQEIKGLGIEEIVADKSNLILIEWPEKIAHLLPRQRWEIKLEAVSENKRNIEINEVKG